MMQICNCLRKGMSVESPWHAAAAYLRACKLLPLVLQQQRQQRLLQADTHTGSRQPGALETVTTNSTEGNRELKHGVQCFEQ
jgi:hypothetical protein